MPGGVAADLDGSGIDRLERIALAEIKRRFPSSSSSMTTPRRLQDRTVDDRHSCSRSLPGNMAAGGYVGRASGRDFDARRQPGYPPYDALAFDVPVLAGRRRRCARLDSYSTRSSRASR